jgi:carbon monoxide dehydrogenase subunit G
MRIENEAAVGAPIANVWEFFNDVPRVAVCLPGGELTKVVDERTYEGIVKVKIGPIAMTYQGDVVLEEIDEAGRTVSLRASGRDRRGAGTARATVTAALVEEAADRTRVSVVTDLHLTGKAASMGGRGVKEVSAKLFAQFVDNVTAELESETAAGTTAPAPDGTASAPAPEARRSGEVNALQLVWSILVDKVRKLLRIRGRP